MLSMTAQAQSDAKLATTVVTASRTSELLSQVTADMTVITPEEMARSGATGVADVLGRVAGVQLNRNGGVGQSTSVYMRGAASQYAAVFIDGVRYDSQEISGGAVWESIPLAQIERIEVLRGPAAAVYGSDAMAGVVHIITRKGGEQTQPFVEIGVGNYGTTKAAAGISGRREQLRYGLSLSDERQDGFNVLEGANPDKDGYRSTAINLHGGLKLGRHDLEVGLLHNRFKAQYDNLWTQPLADHFDTKDLTTLSARWSADWNDIYRTMLQVSRSDTEIERSVVGDKVKTEITNYLLQNQWRLGAHRLNADIERREDRFEANYIARDGMQRNQNALALGYQWSDGRHTLHANVRHDEVQGLQGKTTGGLGYGLQINEQLRWVASAGTAFRVPTLYQNHYGWGGNPDLKPETSRNLETGLHYDDQRLKLSAVAYQNRFQNLIVYDWASAQPCNCYANEDRVQFRGLTLSGSVRVGQQSNLGGSLDWLDPEVQATGRSLSYRSKRMLKVHADTQAMGWTWGAEAQLYSARFSNPENTAKMPGYGLVNLYAQRQLNQDWTLLARIDNAADKDYQLTKGYYTAGRSVFVSLKWAPRF